MENSTKRNKITTSQLLTLIRRSGSFADVDSLFHGRDEQEELTFCHYLYKVMDAHRADTRDVIMKCGIERSYFYHILSGKKTPARNVILRIALSIPATLAETNQLLRLARQGSLYAKIRRDAILIFCIEKKFTQQQANELLRKYEEVPLYREE